MKNQKKSGKRCRRPEDQSDGCRGVYISNSNVTVYILHKTSLTLKQAPITSEIDPCRTTSPKVYICTCDCTHEVSCRTTSPKFHIVTCDCLHEVSCRTTIHKVYIVTCNCLHEVSCRATSPKFHIVTCNCLNEVSCRTTSRKVYTTAFDYKRSCITNSFKVYAITLQYIYRHYNLKP